MYQILKPSKRDIDQVHPLIHRGYRNMGDLKRAIAGLHRVSGYNYFVSYREACEGAKASGQTFAIQAGYATWVAPGTIYVMW